MFEWIRNLFTWRPPVYAIPEELESTHQMLRCAYPDGVPDYDYRALLYVLAQTMSQRQEATAMEVTFNMDYFNVYQDVLGAGEPPPEVLERVKRRLEQCGYAAWLVEP